MASRYGIRHCCPGASSCWTPYSDRYCSWSRTGAAAMDGLPELLVPASTMAGLARRQPRCRRRRLAGAVQRRAARLPRLTYDQALDEALCFGWIDGQVGRRDEGSYRQRWTPRRATSPWSARNVEHIARLTADGRMRPAGVAAVEAAKADGRWEVACRPGDPRSYPGTCSLPSRKTPKAQAMYDVLTKGNRYSLIYRVNEAKRAETRARRIAQFVAMLAKGETFHPQRKRPRNICGEWRSTRPFGLATTSDQLGEAVSRSMPML